MTGEVLDGRSVLEACVGHTLNICQPRAWISQTGSPWEGETVISRWCRLWRGGGYPLGRDRKCTRSSSFSKHVFVFPAFRWQLELDNLQTADGAVGDGRHGGVGSLLPSEGILSLLSGAGMTVLLWVDLDFVRKGSPGGL